MTAPRRPASVRGAGAGLRAERKGLIVNSRNLYSGRPGRMTDSCGKKHSGKHNKHKRPQRHGRLSRLIAGW